MKIYVGNISRTAKEGDVRELFESFGTVTSCVIIKDRFNGESKGFGFVEMQDDEEAKAAMSALNSSVFQGKTLTVNEARPREPRAPGEGRSFGGGGGERREWSPRRNDRPGGGGGGGGGGRRQGGPSYNKDRW